MELVIATTAFLGLIVVAVYFYCSQVYDYWNKKGIKGPKPTPFFGSFLPFALGKSTFGGIVRDIYFQYKNEKVVALYNGLKPALLIRDVEMIKRILIKDFDYFDDRGFFKTSSDLGDHLFSVEATKWRVLRQKLSPVFTSGKLKNMYYLIHDSVEKFEKYLTEKADMNTELEFRDAAQRYTMEAIGSCAFGLEINGINDRDNMYRVIGRQFQAHVVWKTLIQRLTPSLAKFLDISSENADVCAFFRNLVKKVVAEREGKLKTRHDFMDLLMELKEQGEVKGTRAKTEEEIVVDFDEKLMAAQAFVFFVAGYDTSSSTMSFMIHEFIHHPEIQEKAREEIDAVYKKHGKFTYEAIHELEYLEMCMTETLRKYPITEFLARESNADYYSAEIDQIIEKDVLCFISLLGINHDPEIFPDPEAFIPERFSKENKANNPFLSFGDGPRNCIGKRFAKVQTLLGMATLLRSFILKRSPKTVDTFDYKKNTIHLESVQGIWAKIERKTAN